MNRAAVAVVQERRVNCRGIAFQAHVLAQAVDEYAGDQRTFLRRGGFLFVFINGRLITELQIDKRVSDGKIYIPSGLTAADVELMKKQWRLLGERKR